MRVIFFHSILEFYYILIEEIKMLEIISVVLLVGIFSGPMLVETPVEVEKVEVVEPFMQ